MQRRKMTIKPNSGKLALMREIVDRVHGAHESLTITQSQLQRIPITGDVWLDEGDPLLVAETPDVKDAATNRSWCSNDFYWLGYARVGDTWMLAVKISRGTWIRQGQEWSRFFTGEIAVKPLLDCPPAIQAEAQRNLPDLFEKLESRSGGGLPDSWEVRRGGTRVVARRPA